MNYPTIDIIICTYNNERIIGQCLKHVKELDYPQTKCIVVDDFSSDNTVKIIEKNFPWVRIIKKEKQSGPSISRNLAIKNSGSKYLLFLDSDVFVSKSFLKDLMRGIKAEKQVGIIGGKLILPNGKIDSVGGGILRIGVGFDIGHNKDRGKYIQRQRVMYIPSAAMLINRKLLEKIDYFDETYFYGHEDTDLCWRANIAGFKVYCEPSAIAHHSKNITVKNMQKDVYYYGVRNRIRSLLKNHQFFNLLFYGSLYKLYLFSDILIRSHKKEKIRAWLWNLKNIKDTWGERQKIQSLRVIPDRDLPFSKLYSLITG